MMRRFGLRDDQWERIKDLLPGREGSVGVTAADNRLFVDAVLYRYRTGMPWRDLPERFGDGVQVHRRFSRWAKKRCLGAGVPTHWLSVSLQFRPHRRIPPRFSPWRTG